MSVTLMIIYSLIIIFEKVKKKINYERSLK